MLEPKGEMIVGPREIAELEQLRAEAVAKSGRGLGGLGPSVPTDVMVWANGEPPDRAMTKAGGLPYRPAHLPWPAGRDGEPATFIGQICFADSRDLISGLSLPGDVLTLFSAGADGIWDDDDEDPGALIHEWYPLGLTALVDAAAVRDKPQSSDPCYAELHRTWDYPKVPGDHPLRNYNDADRLCVIEGGKIGGLSSYAQFEPAKPGTFLAALGSINACGRRFPVIGMPVNPGGEYQTKENYLTFGDCGSLYLLISRAGRRQTGQKLRWTVQGY